MDKIVMGRVLFLVLIAVFPTLLMAQSRAFKGGEQLRYVAQYKIGLFNVDIATIDMVTQDETFKGEKCYKINAVGQVLPQYRWFFDMRDEYSVWLDKTSLKPLYFENDIKEGSYTLVSNYVYDWNKMSVRTYENRPVWDEPQIKEHTIEENSLEALSLFHSLRNISLD